MDVTYRFTTDGVRGNEVENLFRVTELGARRGDKIRRAFENSSLVCFAFDGAQLIGSAGRSRIGSITPSSTTSPCIPTTNAVGSAAG